MESLLIFVLFAVGSTIFQVIKENAKKQAAQPAPKPIRTTIQPVVPPHKNPSNQNAGSINSKKKQPSPVPRNASTVGNKISTEGIQAEVLGNNVIEKPSSEQDAPSGTNILQDISIDELQRSIIMAEVLGKPKALKKSIR